MKLGLIARADNRGLGIQTWEFAQHMNPDKVLVLDIPSEQPLEFRNRFPDAAVLNRWPEPGDYACFLQDLDCVYTAETPYHHSLFSLAEQLDVRTVLAVNPEFLDHLDHLELPKPTVFACPSTWMFEKVPQPKTLLPFPVATERFKPNYATQATNFLHIVGRPAIHDRAGTKDLLAALKYVRSDIKLTLCCQQPGHVESYMNMTTVPGNVKVDVRSRDVDNYWDNYTDQHVLILPRRFGGMCLPMQEGLAAGCPVIMPNVTPNNDRLPRSWLTDAHHGDTFEVRGQPIAIHETDPQELGGLIDRFARDKEFYAEAKRVALMLAESFSWDHLKPRYTEVFGG